MRDTLERLKTTIWITAGARYNASRRLSLRDSFSTVSLAMFSVVTIGLAVVQKIYFTADSPADKYGTVLGVTLGAFLLAISLLEAGKGNALLAEALHRNAEELTALTKRIDLRVSAHDAGRLLTEADLAEFNEGYESIKARCVTNHAPKDYLLFIGEKRMAPEFAKKDGTPRVTGWQYRCRHTWWLLSSVWYFLLLWLTIAYLCYENWAQYAR
ncbi:SLATT domain-containing protein [Burkholderia paludis]|uniref:SLATT domain-containing protein n=1 Tax=Burkholderia paludis TaxID=1506587 RepID=UPI00126A1C98|nr:SLATT domain-containing protein [Burkholderia paludis]